MLVAASGAPTIASALPRFDDDRVEVKLEESRDMTEPDPYAKPQSEGEGLVVPAPPRRRRGDDTPDKTRRIGLIIAVLLTSGAGGIAGLVLNGMQDNSIYSKPVDVLMSEKAKFANRPVRAEGNLVHGSLMKRDQPCEYRFTITKNGVDLPVRYAQCVVPDTFRDVPGMDVGVTVEGKLLADNTFEATNVLAKCPSKYEMKERQQRGESMPHGPTAQQY
jgi:cytochrome c-type biogenesis protein CcmE